MWTVRNETLYEFDICSLKLSLIRYQKQTATAFSHRSSNSWKSIYELKNMIAFCAHYKWTFVIWTTAKILLEANFHFIAMDTNRNFCERWHECKCSKLIEENYFLINGLILILNNYLKITSFSLYFMIDLKLLLIFSIKNSDLVNPVKVQIIQQFITVLMIMI